MGGIAKAHHPLWPFSWDFFDPIEDLKRLPQLRDLPPAGSPLKKAPPIWVIKNRYLSHQIRLPCRFIEYQKGGVLSHLPRFTFVDPNKKLSPYFLFSLSKNGLIFQCFGVWLSTRKFEKCCFVPILEIAFEYCLMTQKKR